MRLTVPRRHSAKTLRLLILYYGGIGALGVLSVILIGAAFVLTGAEMTPERFAYTFSIVALFGAAIMIALWHGYVRPRIRYDREMEFEEFESLKRRYGVK